MRDAKTKNATIWDAFLTLKVPSNTDFIAKGTPFSQYPCTEDFIGLPDKTRYRSLLCCSGTSAAIMLSTKRLFVGTLLPQKITPTLDRKHMKTVSFPRPFSAEITTALVVPPSNVRCHSISYSYIENCLVDLINMFFDTPDDRTFENCIEGLEILVSSVTLTKKTITSDEDKYAYYAWVALLGNDENTGLVALLAEKRTTMAIKSDAANQLLDALNNNLSNLRLDRNDWNSSLQEHYDCRSWKFVYQGADSIFYFGSSFDNALLETPARSSGYPEFEEFGFYLMDNYNDGERLKVLSELSTGVWEYNLPQFKTGILVDTETQNMQTTDTRRCILYSSSNKWDLNKYPIDDIDPAYRPAIHVVHDGEWITLPY